MIQAASLLGIPLSTTHVISSSIMGVGAAKRFNAVRWSVMARLIWAWVFTLPITGTIGYCLFYLFKLTGLWNSIEWSQPH